MIEERDKFYQFIETGLCVITSFDNRVVLSSKYTMEWGPWQHWINRSDYVTGYKEMFTLSSIYDLKIT